MNELFANISLSKREKILQKLEASSVKYQKKGRILIRDESIGIVLAGTIKIIKNNVNGDTELVEEYHTNEIFVITSVITKSEDYEIIAKEDSCVTIIDFESITTGIIENNASFNQFLRNVIKIMNNSISKQNERIEILVHKTIRNKLLAYFKIMYDKTTSHIIYLPSTFKELADYLAIDRSAMNRELKHLKDEGFIEITNKKIKLLYLV